VAPDAAPGPDFFRGVLESLTVLHTLSSALRAQIEANLEKNADRLLARTGRGRILAAADELTPMDVYFSRRNSPDPRIFHTALDALAADASNTAHVGDLLRTDVAGSRRVRMTSIRIRAVYDDPTSSPTPTPSCRRSSNPRSADCEIRLCTWIGGAEGSVI